MKHYRCDTCGRVFFYEGKARNRCEGCECNESRRTRRSPVMGFEEGMIPTRVQTMPKADLELARLRMKR